MYIDLKAGRKSILLDEKLFALIILPLLFLLITGLFFKFAFQSLLWAFVYLLATIWFILDYRVTFGLIWKWRVVFLLPGLALLSVIWSTQPQQTLVTAIQFTFSTLVAMRLAVALKTQTVISALLFATMIGVVLSLASPFIGWTGPIYESNGSFIGIYVQKTVAGVAFALAAIAIMCIGQNRKYLLVRSVFALALAPLVVATLSVSGLIVYSVVPVIIALKLIAHKSTTFHLATLASGLIFTIAVLLTFWLDGISIVAWFLEAVGKSPTLTGRTDIWAVGLEIWRDYPLLGVGFNGFWSNPRFAEDVGFLHATVDPRLVGFHNVYVETLVTTGILGTILAAVVYVWTFFRCFLWHISTGTSDAIFWVSITFIGLAFSLTDNALFGEHEKFHILFTMAFIFAADRPTIRVMLPK